jgi:anti-anti-sigma factor
MSPEREPSENGPSAITVRPSGPFSISSVVVGTTAVLKLAGRVDLGTLPTCRRAVDALLQDGVTLITVDLRVAGFDDESIALLALMRRYTLRHGARLALVDIPPHIARVLDRTGVGWLYRQDGDTPTPTPAPTPAGDHARAHPLPGANVHDHELNGGA